MKYCTQCGQLKEYRDFYLIYKKGKQDYQAACKECMKASARAWYHANKERARESNKRTIARLKYNLEGEQYNAMQKIFACEVCGSTERLHIDHDHLTGKVRGKLCSNCNSALGMVNDNVRTLESLIAYLNRSKTAKDLAQRG
jgi:hypothetical protein